MSFFGCSLKFELGLRRERSDDLLQVFFLFGREVGHIFFDELDHLALAMLGTAKVFEAINAGRIDETGQPFTAGKAFQV